MLDSLMSKTSLHYDHLFLVNYIRKTHTLNIEKGRIVVLNSHSSISNVSANVI